LLSSFVLSSAGVKLEPIELNSETEMSQSNIRNSIKGLCIRLQRSAVSRVETIVVGP
jgi:hypothetical protein